MTQCRLRDVPVGGMARVVGIDDTHRSYRSRILSMGLTRGTPIFVQRIAPLGDPIHITVRDFELSLRRDEADALILEPIEGEPEAFGFCARCRGRGKWRKGLRARRGRAGRGRGLGRRGAAGHDDGAPGSGGRGRRDGLGPGAGRRRHGGGAAFNGSSEA